MSSMISLPRQKNSPDDFKLYKSLGSLIKGYRQWRSMTQEELAESIGISVRELQKWEANLCRARIDNLHDLSEYTGIPMHACVAINAEQPIWYSLRKRRFAYSFFEEPQLSSLDLLKYREKPGDRILVKSEPITKDRHINMILKCHQDTYGTKTPLERDVIKRASLVLPDQNFIIFDSWGHYVGHLICLPIKANVYQELKTQNGLENYLTTEKICDIIALNEGVLFYYSQYAASLNVAYCMLKDSIQYLSKIEKKERFLIASCSPTNVREMNKNLGYRLVRKYSNMSGKMFPAIFEVELHLHLRAAGPREALGIEQCNKKTGAKNLTRELKQEGLPAIPAQKQNSVKQPAKKYSSRNKSEDGSLTVDKYPFLSQPVFRVGDKQDDQKKVENQIDKSKTESCPNPQCAQNSKRQEDNIVSNGTYRRKDGTIGRRFICRQCGKSFCSRTESLLYKLRSPEERVLTALKLLAKGKSLRSVEKTLGVKRNTLRNWLELAAEQSDKIEDLLTKRIGVTQVELDALWAFVKTNSLRKRAILRGA